MSEPVFQLEILFVKTNKLRLLALSLFYSSVCRFARLLKIFKNQSFRDITKNGLLRISDGKIQSVSN